MEAELPGGLRLRSTPCPPSPRSTRISHCLVRGVRGVALAFRCADPAEVDALHGALTAAGHASERVPWDAFWGQRYATVLDPDGNPVDLFAALR